RQIVQIGVGDSDPGERGELEVAAADVRIESAPLVDPDVDRDADRPELGLDSLRQPPTHGLRGRLVDEPETGRARTGRPVAGAVEQPARAPGIVAWRSQPGVCPVPGGEPA